MPFIKKELPLLSFVTPNYNDGDTIEKMVDSIMSQDWDNIEQIIVDDGSTDGSKKVLEKLEKKYPKLKIIYMDKNRGACTARNLGASHAKGKYISFLPADAVLYPGVARIWVESLERNPQYDFIYGGYKFVDANGHEVFCYESDGFDPYLLEVTNYIDGSFPLKKELFDKMGGWDVNIKSLQDWEFWLNAVKQHGANGLFKKEIYFETTLPHPGGLSDDSSRNWVARLDQIKQKHNIPFRNICVTGQGATFHAKNVAKMLNADFLPNPSFKPHKYEMIYIIGFFGQVDQALWNTRALRVVHWIGSDIMHIANADEKVREETVKWIDSNIDINLCEMEATRKELEAIGIKARVVPFPPRIISDLEVLPKKFSIAVYNPYNNADFYFPDFIKNLAKKLPDIDFHFFGDPTLHGKKDNIIHCGVTNEEETKKLIKDTSCILRLTPHDGLPLSVVEWIMAGRNAITTVDMPFSNVFNIDKFDGKVPTKKEIEKVIAENEVRLIKLIKKVKNQKLNIEGANYYKKVCDVKKFKKTIYDFMKCDIKKWWKENAEIWSEVENGQIETDDIMKAVKEIKLLKPKSIVDMGCGTGRWADMLPEADYLGIDFTAELIKKAKKEHPEKKFLVGDFNYKPKKKHDVLFTFASLLHVKPEDIAQTAQKMAKIAHTGVLIEPVNETPQNGKGRFLHAKIIEKQKNSDWIFNVKYTWVHDYFKHFNVIKAIPMSNNRMMFIVDLDKPLK